MKKLLMLVVTLMLGASLAIAQTDSSKSGGDKSAQTTKASSKKTAKKAPAKKDAKKGSSDKKDAGSK
jgi:hypothetical protein